mmetsp:Transcript_18925/g.41235  ORF Transcript_18925/g.41235 Transcript_18925/m.41235 type:complete len:93 (-) Transcript_18925:1597-1875(-)
MFKPHKLDKKEHESSINLARRLSRMNQEDLLQEPFYETEYEKNKFTHDFCAELSDHLVHFKNLPVQCNKYTDVVDKMKKKDKDTTPGTADLS